MRLSTTSKISFWLFLLSIISYILKYGLNVFLAGNMTTVIYGDYSVAIRVLAIVANVSLLGSATSSKRFLAKYFYYHQVKDITNYVRWNLRLISKPFLICLTLAFLLSILIICFDYFSFNDFNDYYLIVYMFWIAPVSAVGFLLYSYLLCDDKVILSFLLQKPLKYVFYIIGFVSVVKLFHLELSFLVITSIILLTSLLLLLIAAVYVWKLTPEVFYPFTFKKIAREPEKETKWHQVSKQLIINNILFVLLCTIDLLIIKIFMPTAHSAGLYAAVLIITGILWLIPQSILQVLKPKVSQYMRDDYGKTQLQHLLQLMNFFIFGISIIFSICLIVFSHALLRSFGPEYVQMQTILYILTFANFIGILSSAGAIVLSYANQEKTLLKINLTELLLVLILGVILTLFYGLTGMAVATTISISWKTINVIYTVHKRLQLKALFFI